MSHPSLLLRPICFDRREFAAILSVYGRMVSAGLWRDYALDALSDRALFSVFKRSSESPSYQIEKRPALARRQGAFSVIGPNGVILRRGDELRGVLRVFDRQLIRLAGD